MCTLTAAAILESHAGPNSLLVALVPIAIIIRTVKHWKYACFARYKLLKKCILFVIEIEILFITLLHLKNVKIVNYLVR